jgi:hypothetical protein
VSACSSSTAKPRNDAGAQDVGTTIDVSDEVATPDAVMSPDVGAPVDTGAVPDGAATVPLRNVDVTIIYPLPAAADLDALLKPADVGLGGALLTADAFDQGHVPELDGRDPLTDDAARLAALRVVAVRVDPCPGNVVPPPAGATCTPELRLVFQSLKVDGSDTTARDGAIHTFHALSPTDFDAVVRALRDIRAERSGDLPMPLDIHPLLRAEGPSGAYAQRLRALLLAHAGTANLVRVTHFRRDPQYTSWQFALREIAAGAWRDGMLPTIAVTEEHLVTISGGRWDADITPAVTSPDDPRLVLHAQTDQRVQAFSATVRVLNPRVHSNQSIDCASCHVAPDIAIFVGSTASLRVQDDAQHFQSAYPLDAVPKSSTEAIAFQNIHMASYSGRTLSLSTRTVNETAAVLEMLNGG